jgi:hypothetical protein
MWSACNLGVGSPLPMKRASAVLRATALAVAVAVCNGHAVAQVPDAFKHSIFDPNAAPQDGAQQGASVASDGDFVVVGAPLDDLKGYDCGVVKVYHAATGALLHTLINPRPTQSDNFGKAVRDFRAGSPVPRRPRPPPLAPWKYTSTRTSRCSGVRVFTASRTSSVGRRPFGVIGADPRGVEDRVPDLRRPCLPGPPCVDGQPSSHGQQPGPYGVEVRRHAGPRDAARRVTNVSCSRSRALAVAVGQAQQQGEEWTAVLALQCGQLVLGGRPGGDGGGSAVMACMSAAPGPRADRPGTRLCGGRSKRSVNGAPNGRPRWSPGFRSRRLRAAVRPDGRAGERRTGEAAVVPP